MRSSILNLPPEVLTEICSYFPTDAPAPFIADLASICRVNKLFHQIATPMLYRDVHLNYTSIFYDNSRILGCFLDSEHEEEHPGIRLIRNLRISNGRPRPSDSEDFDEDRDDIYNNIAEFISKIKPNQLSSLSIDTGDLEFYNENLEEQNNLKNLHLRSYPLVGDDEPSSLPEAWSQQIEPHLSRLTDPTTSLSLSSLEMDIGLVTIMGIDIKRTESSSSLRPIKFTAIKSILDEPSFDTQFNQTIRNIQNLIAFLLLHTKEKGFYLQELDVEVPCESMTRTYLKSELLTFGLDKLQKLTLRHSNPILAVTDLVFPLAKNLTDLRLHNFGEQKDLNDAIATLPCKLKVLHIARSDPEELYIAPRALRPHSTTLESLWLENSLQDNSSYRARTLPLALYPGPDYLDWSFLISNKFPKLREVAVCLDVDTVEEGLVGENIQLLRLLNGADFECVCGHSLKGFAEQAFTKAYERESSSKLKAIAFGTPDKKLYRQGPECDEISIFLGRREKDILGREVVRCTPVSAKQARHLLPDITIIGENEWSLKSLEEWPKSEV
ncbi:hypothetical protein TWF281_008015 [Arthrobotrys megalospora]